MIEKIAIIYIMIAGIVGVFLVEDGAPLIYAMVSSLLWPLALLISIAEEIYRRIKWLKKKYF